MENISRVFKTKKIYTKRLSFITQFKIEFLLLFTGCRKVLGKMLSCSVTLENDLFSGTFSETLF